MKHCKKAVALLLSVLMILSLFSVVGFAEDEPITVTFYRAPQGTSAVEIWKTVTVNEDHTVDDPAAGLTEAQLRQELRYPPLSTPGYKVVFKGWSQDLTNITSSIGVFPIIDEEPKQYEITFHNWEGQVVTDPGMPILCEWGDKLTEVPTSVREPDATYEYTFYGWSLKPNLSAAEAKEAAENGENYVVHWTDHFYLPKDIEGEEPIKVNVYPCFIYTYREYPVSIRVVDTNGQPLKDASVSLLDSNRNVIKQTVSAKDDEGNPTGQPSYAKGLTNSEGRIRFTVSYRPEYTVSVSYQKLDLAKEIKATVSEMTGTGGLTIKLESSSLINEGGKPRCTCICHSFLGGLWVNILNLMHSLLKVNYVCCPDMFETHGKDLAYGK